MKSVRSRVVIFVLPAAFALVCALPRTASAQVTRGDERAVQAAPASIADDADARATLTKLNELLRRYPPSLGRVLKLDPSLLSNQAYLASYPALATFLTQHPDVSHNPVYFLSGVVDAQDYYNVPTDRASVRLWQEMMSGFAALFVFGTIVAALTWVIRLIAEHRRWGRASKVQAEAHNKLLDRLTANDELVAYMQSPAGSRFLESAPLVVDSGRSVHAPIGRILLSVQIGLVLAAGGIGLYFVNRHVDADAAQPIFAMGVLAIALGSGFVLSAVVSFVLSRRLGLLDPPAALPHVERGAASARNV